MRPRIKFWITRRAFHAFLGIGFREHRAVEETIAVIELHLVGKDMAGSEIVSFS